MCDVTAENFESLWPQIEADINRASFVAFDCEFSALSGFGSTESSLFDTMPERYLCLRDNLRHCLIVQCGLSVFVRSRVSCYIAHTYNFYLCPRAHGSLDRCFVFQPSSLQFLQMHNFDFNKVIYEGISFMNEYEESLVQSETGEDFELSCAPSIDANFIQRICSEVARWLEDTERAGEDELRVVVTQPTLRYQLHQALRSRFKQIWTTDNCKELVVMRVGSVEGRQRLADGDDLPQRFVNTLLGFTRVVRHLSRVQVPLVGHNCLTDLVLFHSMFLSPLPESYDRFKSVLHRWFPEVYDTKHIIHHIKAKYKRPEIGALDSSSLAQLYHSLVKFHVLFGPDIEHSSQSSRYADTELLHEAGYDAFLTGFCLLRLAHVIAHIESPSSDYHRALDWNEHRAAIRPFNNRINVIRAAVNHTCLDGPDRTTSCRPQLLHITHLRDKPLSRLKLVLLLSHYGTVDIRMNGANQALVATGNHSCAGSILRAFRHDLHYRVERYSPFKHNQMVRLTLWSSAVTCGALILLLLTSQFARQR